MSMRSLLLAAALLATPLLASAQSPASDSLFRRAERLVREGNGEDGRRLVDSALAAAQPGSFAHAEALYWRAVLSPSGADAERDLRRLTVEYPAHARAEDATLRLAQLELARGDRERALAHLQRFEREYAGSARRGLALLLLGRTYLEQRDATRARAALVEAQRVTASSGDVELKNQIAYYLPRAAAAAGEQRPATEQQASSDTKPPAPTAQRPTPTATQGRFTIQVAAFNTRREAESLVDALASRKVEARVVGSAKPFRVRTGRYATRAAANEALRALKAKRLNGYVTEAERTP